MFSHINKQDQPQMVDISEKQASQRSATASAFVVFPPEILEMFEKQGFQTKKGAIFQAAIIAGTMAAKQTWQMIPFCHPIQTEACQIEIKKIDAQRLQIIATVRTSAKTGVEMEALTAASLAALTVYDMCKSASKELTITDIVLLEKTGGKSDYNSANSNEQ